MKRLTTEEFIKRCKEIYGDKYSYSKVNYINSSTNVCVTCSIHGDFLTIPNNCIKGHGCPACAGRQRINTDIFIKRATEIHKGRYDYSLVKCDKGKNSFVDIICPIHGKFTQKAVYHLNGNGCPKCFGTPKSNTEEFIEKAKKIYGDKYSYSNVDYQGNKIKVLITCPVHGDWPVRPNAFLRGSECPKCYGTPKYTTEEFIEKARAIHGDKYDYSKVNYRGNKEKVRIICPIHGEFSQIAGTHLRGGGCYLCSVGYRVIRREKKPVKKGEKPAKVEVRVDRDLFIRRSRETHEIQYDYSKTALLKSTEKICIICPKHGEFWQSLGYHMRGGNCPRCAGSYKLTTEEFIERSNKVHGNRYDYSKVEYKNYSTKVCIVCPIHGEFWQTPNNHLFGSGCPACPQSNLEGELREVLIKRKIRFEQEKTFTWLRYKKKMFLDFYLPDYQIAIECQGGQHFKPVPLFGGEDFFNKTLDRDIAKHDLCEKNGITVLYFSKTNEDYLYPVIKTYGELIKAIKQNKK